MAVRNRWHPGRACLITSGIGIAIFLGWAAFQTSPYLDLAEQYPEATQNRTEGWARFLSPPPSAFLAAPEQSFLWGEPTREQREDLPFAVEQTMFPGALVGVMGIAGLIISSFPARTRLLLGFFIILSAVLSLGFKAGWFSQFFEFLYTYAPGWSAGRTPGRLTTFTTLGLGLSAAGAVEWIVRFFRRRHRPMVRRFAIPFAILFFLIAVVEGAGETPVHEVPSRPDANAVAAPEPQVHLPTDYGIDALHMYWSIGDYPRIVNGSLGLMPRQLERLRRTLRGFPDDASVNKLRRLGVRSVFFHEDLLEKTDWPTPPPAPPPHLNLETSLQGSTTIYLLDD
jgi:hypothetical protein